MIFNVIPTFYLCLDIFLPKNNHLSFFKQNTDGAGKRQVKKASDTLSLIKFCLQKKSSYIFRNTDGGGKRKVK